MRTSVLCSHQEVVLLTFTRKIGEAVRIGEEIRITIKQVKGRQVRLVIEAPRSIPVFREEVFQQIVAENERAARVAPDLLKGLD